MTHKIIKKRFIQSNQWLIEVNLLPQNQTEMQAIENVYRMQATDAERQLIEDYLNFNLDLGSYSIVKPLSHIKNIIQLQVYIG